MCVSVCECEYVAAPPSLLGSRMEEGRPVVAVPTVPCWEAAWPAQWEVSTVLPGERRDLFEADNRACGCSQWVCTTQSRACTREVPTL